MMTPLYVDQQKKCYHFIPTHVPQQSQIVIYKKGSEKGNHDFYVIENFCQSTRRYQ